jgi:hypothetical protein
MAENAGVDYPEARTVVDLLVTSRGDVLLSWVESSDGSEFVVSTGEDRSQRRVRLEPGEHVEVVWRGPEELRSRPTELVSTQLDPPQWRLRPVGPATRGQRRSSVRAPLGFRVQATIGADLVHGSTIDLSEGGMRALFAPPGEAGTAPSADPRPADASVEPPEGPVERPEATTSPVEGSRPAEDPVRIGAVLSLVVCLEQDEVACRGEVTRRIARQDGRTELCFRFVDLHEKSQDLIRRHVFAGLRMLRARGLL